MEKKISKKTVINIIGGCVITGIIGITGYTIGYRHAQTTAFDITDIMIKNDPESKESFIKAWNKAVFEYFSKKKGV